MKDFFISYVKLQNQVLGVLRYGRLDVLRSLLIYWTIDGAHHTFCMLGKVWCHYEIQMVFL